MSNTENLYFVSKDECLKYFDLYNAEVWDIDVHAMGLRASEALRDQIKQKLSQALHDYFEGNSDMPAEEREEHKQRMQEMFDSLVWIKDNKGYEASLPLEILMLPVHLTPWVRLSDCPLESFVVEDYQSREVVKSPVPSTSQFVPVFGSFELRSLDQWELSLPGQPGEMPFFLEWDNPQDAVQRNPIDALAPLPIVDEFIGLTGASARGCVANYTLGGKISEENTITVAIGRFSESLYVTLYLHITQQIEFDVAFDRLPAKPEIVNERLIANGFSPFQHDGGWAIYARDDERDVVHFYYDIEGRESVRMPRVKPFLWIARAGGESTPGKRSRMMELLVQMFPPAGDSAPKS